jgi:hypothetical protein
MALEWPEPKDPNEVLDYQILWNGRLISGDEIVNSTWIITPAGLVKDDDEFTVNSTLIWLSSGTVDTTYDLTNRVITSGGRTMDQTVRLRIRVK